MKSVKRLINLFNNSQNDYCIYIISSNKGTIYYGIVDKLAKAHCTNLVKSYEEFFAWFVEWYND